MTAAQRKSRISRVSFAIDVRLISIADLCRLNLDL
jgi:hypothetical protein